MADNMMWCENKHPDGVCKINGEYCVEAPCPHCKPVEYAPVRHGKPVEHIEVFCNSDGEPICEYIIGRECPFCGNDAIGIFCSMCGAKMDWEEAETSDQIPRDQWEDAARYE